MRRYECAICLVTLTTIIGLFILIAVVSINFTESSNSVVDSWAKQNQTEQSPALASQ